MPTKKEIVYTQADWDINSFPDPPSGDDEDYGPTEMQENLFIYHREPWERDHFHTLTIDLMIGAAASGKTIATIAEVIEVCAAFPGTVAVVCGKNMPLLKRNVVDKFGERLSYTGPDGINRAWKHPFVLRAPAEKTPHCIFINGSSIRFLNIDDPEIVRGFTADIFAIEEVNLMKANSLKEMLRRSRGMALPVRQFILNMNPTGARDWVYDMFNLKQFKNDYKGPPLPIGEPCECQHCHVCLGADLGKFEWVGGEKKIGPNGKFYAWVGGECSNPECPTLLKNIEKGRGLLKQKKSNPCPGGQYYYRVIRSASLDNPHIPSDFTQLQKGALSAEEYATYVKGEIVDLNTGYIYKEFSDANIGDVEFDPDKDMYWTMDFNKDPMCSQVVQDSGDVFHVVDEFTLWGADERAVAEAFCARYKGYKGTVGIYGDPNGITTSSRADSTKVSFKFLYDYLRKEGFKAYVGVKKVEGQTLIPIPDRIKTLKAALKTVDGTSRIIISPKCVNLIESLRHSKWDEKSKRPHEDENCDANAKLNPRRYEEAVLMTHPQAALGYLVFKEKKFLLNKTGVKIMITEDSTIIGDAKEIKVEKRVEVPAPVVEEPEEPEFSISNLCGFGGSSIVQERLEYERQQAEEYKRRRSG